MALADADKGLKGHLAGANPHTIWIRDDIWEAVKLYKLRNKDSLRSVVEQALLSYLSEVNKSGR